MTRKYTDEQIRHAAKLYKEGAPYDVIEQHTGIPPSAARQAIQRYRRIVRPRSASWAWREKHAPWHLLAGIKPVINPPRGYSTFTAEEGARIRAFCMEQQVPASVVARHFGVRHGIVNKIINRDTNFNRPALPTAAGKKKYAKEKAQRMSGRPWVSAEQEVGR